MFPFQNSVINYQLHFQPHKSSSCSAFPWKSYYHLPTPQKKYHIPTHHFFKGAKDFFPLLVRPAVPKRQLSLRSGCIATRRWGCFWETRGPPFWGLFLFKNFSLGGWLCSHRKYRNIPLSATNGNLCYLCEVGWIIKCTLQGTNISHLKKKEHHRLCLLWVEYVSFEEGTPAMEPENGPWKRRFRTPSFSGEPCYTSGVCTLEN